MAAGEKLLRAFAEVFRTRALCIFEAETAKLHSLGRSQSRLPSRTRAAYIQGKESDSPLIQVSVRLLRAGGKTTGAMGFEGLEDPQFTAGPLASLAAVVQEQGCALRRASEYAAAAEANAYRLVILETLAHEFKSPLATILAAAGALRAGSLGPEQLAMTAAMETEAALLGNLTTRQLRMARLECEEVCPQMEVLDVSSMLTDIVTEYMRLPSDRRLRFSEPGGPIEALADPELVRLALFQLLDNACKHSLPDSAITVTAESKGDTIFIRVTNTGSSIPKSEQNRIFERFYRSKEARRSSVGFGLGLHVARKIAHAHGGQLDLDTERQGEGVTFYLALPKALRA